MPIYTVRVEDTSPLIEYKGQWSNGSGDPLLSLYSASSFHGSHFTGAAFTFLYTGFSCRVYGAKRFNHGQFEASVDDTVVMGNTFAPDLGLFKETIFSYNAITPNGDSLRKERNLTLVNKGLDGDWLDVDWIEFEAGKEDELKNPMKIANATLDDNHSSIVYTGDWQKDTRSENFKGTAHYTTKRNDKVTITFLGDSIYVFGGNGFDYGNYTVELDGNPRVVNRTPGVQFKEKQLLWFADGLGGREQKLTLTNLEENKKLDIDYAVVSSSVPLSSSAAAVSPLHLVLVVALSILSLLLFVVLSICLFFRYRRRREAARRRREEDDGIWEKVEPYHLDFGVEWTPAGGRGKFPSPDITPPWKRKSHIGRAGILQTGGKAEMVEKYANGGLESPSRDSSQGDHNSLHGNSVEGTRMQTVTRTSTQTRPARNPGRPAGRGYFVVPLDEQQNGKENPFSDTTHFLPVRSNTTRSQSIRVRPDMLFAQDRNHNTDGLSINTHVNSIPPAYTLSPDPISNIPDIPGSSRPPSPRSRTNTQSSSEYASPVVPPPPSPFLMHLPNPFPSPASRNGASGGRSSGARPLPRVPVVIELAPAPPKKKLSVKKSTAEANTENATGTVGVPQGLKRQNAGAERPGSAASLRSQAQAQEVKLKNENVMHGAKSATLDGTFYYNVAVGSPERRPTRVTREREGSITPKTSSFVRPGMDVSVQRRGSGWEESDDMRRAVSR